MNERDAPEAETQAIGDILCQPYPISNIRLFFIFV